jgi:hypothetical protein
MSIIIFTAPPLLLTPHLFPFPAQMSIFMCTCSVLTFLQLFWGFKVVSATVKMLKGDKTDRQKEA